jgi:hypothetical protein
MLPPTSIFRRMPGALALSQRRFLGALAYASDCAELSFERLRQAARAYSLPTSADGYEEAGWTPVNRLSIITDAWACVDHLNRARQLVKRSPYGDPRPAEVDPFLAATKPALDIRNRIQHLDEDIFTGANCVEGNPVMGAVSWADARNIGGHVRYSISSGPPIDGGLMAGSPLADVDGAGDVLDFALKAADQTIRLDEIMKALAAFMAAFEVTVERAVILGLREAAIRQGVSLHEPRPHGITDVTMAMRMRRKAEDGWEIGNGDGFGWVEVPVGSFDISKEADDVA